MAAEPPYYFHKVGVARDVYMDDVNDCAALAGGIRNTHYQVLPTNYNAPYAVESSAIANFFTGFLERAERRRIMGRVERTCMADKGYQRRAIAKDLDRELRKLDGPARIDRLFGLVSASVPVGEEMIE